MQPRQKELPSGGLGIAPFPDLERRLFDGNLQRISGEFVGRTGYLSVKQIRAAPKKPALPLCLCILLNYL